MALQCTKQGFLVNDMNNSVADLQTRICSESQPVGACEEKTAVKCTESMADEAKAELPPTSTQGFIIDSNNPFSFYLF